MVLRFSPLLNGYRLSDIFYCWRRVKTSDGERFEGCDANEYFEFSWDEYEYLKFKKGVYRKPKNIVTISLRSRETFSYGLFQFIAKLPKWIFTEDSPILWFGFEVDDLFAGGVCHFSIIKGILRANTGRIGLLTEIPLEFIDLNQCIEKPCIFSIKFFETGATWYVNENLVAVAIFTDEAKIISLSKPYSIAYAPQPSINMPILLDIDGGNTEKEWLWEGIHPWGIRVADGSRHSAININLSYSKDEKTSTIDIHPIPIPRKTYILIEPSENTTLELYYFVENQYKLLEELELKGGKLNVIPITIERSVIKPILRNCKNINIAKATIVF